MNQVKKSSAEWQALNPEVQVLDPDGWDRRNFQRSWFDEQITYEEYVKRRNKSTCRLKRIIKENP